MKYNLIKIIFALVLACALGLTLFARVKKVNAEVAAGNRAFAAADYETALQHYTEAQSQAPGQAEPLYNAANVFYKQQALDQAQQSLDQALAQPQKTVEASIHYNLGNVAYTAQQFDAAVSQYESALRIDPTDQAAKYNLELALLQQKQQQDSKEGQDPKTGQDPQDGEQDPKEGQDQKDLKEGQDPKTGQDSKDGQQDSEEGQDPKNGQQDPKEGQDPKNGEKDPKDGQQGQPDPKEGQDPQEGQQGQTGQPQDQQAGQPDGQAAGGQPQKGLTQEQAERLLAAIAGNSKTLFEQIQMYYQFSGVTPEKDW